ncbi:MAG: hypothetical protein JJU11_17290 [Candidatus Sumerlaeia bacterium]|nr:hypothetical protein [Candidatus Sumerlaeia bacterium]
MPRIRVVVCLYDRQGPPGDAREMPVIRDKRAPLEEDRPLSLAEASLMFVEDEKKHTLSAYYHQLWRETSRLQYLAPYLVFLLLAGVVPLYGSWMLFALLSLVYIYLLQVWMAVHYSRRVLGVTTIDELAAAGMTPRRLKDDIHFYVMFRCQCVMVPLIPVLVAGSLYLGYKNLFGFFGEPFFTLGFIGSVFSFIVYIFLTGLVLDFMFAGHVKMDGIRGGTASLLRELGEEFMGIIVALIFVGFIAFVVFLLRLLFSGWIHNGLAALLLIGSFFLALFLFVKLTSSRMKGARTGGGGEG